MQSTAELTFREFVKLVEDEQIKSKLMLNVILNRQLLYYYWVNVYAPADALKEVLTDEEGH